MPNDYTSDYIMNRDPEQHLHCMILSSALARSSSRSRRRSSSTGRTARRTRTRTRTTRRTRLRKTRRTATTKRTTRSWLSHRHGQEGDQAASGGRLSVLIGWQRPSRSEAAHVFCSCYWIGLHRGIALYCWFCYVLGLRTCTS